MIRPKVLFPVWLSRHEMGEGQKNDLVGYLRKRGDLAEGGDIRPYMENLLWQATEDADADRAANADVWANLFASYKIVLGVFPPVALEGLRSYRARRGVGPKSTRVLTPVSRQTKDERADGTAQISFHHVRWVEL